MSLHEASSKLNFATRIFSAFVSIMFTAIEPLMVHRATLFISRHCFPLGEFVAKEFTDSALFRIHQNVGVYRDDIARDLLGR